MVENINGAELSWRIFVAKGVHYLNFWTRWNKECDVMFRIMNELSNRYSGHFCYIDYEEQEEASSQLEVYGVPTLLVFREGRIIARYSGLLRPQEVESIVRASDPARSHELRKT